MNVTGTPQITLETGSIDRTVDYSSGTGTTVLTFAYTVQGGDTSADLDYTATTSLALNGGTINDAAGNAATLTLATPGAANSLGDNEALVVDAVVPTVSGVDSTTAAGSYKAADAVSIQVNFSEAVTVTGTPQLTLETGATDRTINYVSGTGTSSLTFTYTVQGGDTSADLDYAATSSLALNGGTINDAAGNAATLTLATPGAANSLGDNEALVIDTTVPTVAVDSLSICDVTPDLTGTVNDNSATISVTVNSDLYAATNNGNGTWSLAGTAIAANNGIPNGTYDVSVSATDGATNVGNDATTDELTINCSQFIANWKTDNAGTSTSTAIDLPLVVGGSYDFIVEWETGVTSYINADNDTDKTHDYGSVKANQQVKITGALAGWKFNNAGDKQKLLEISQWGTFSFANGDSHFFGASNLTITATDLPNLTGATSLLKTFQGCSSLTTVPGMENWNTADVTNMASMFSGASDFNQNISGWNTANVTDMNSMFWSASDFNQDISAWNTANVTNMYGVFRSAVAFNQNISSWNTANVTRMDSMFNNAWAFNQNIGSWNTAKVTRMDSMFQTSSFNQDIGSWNTENVTNMANMFRSNPAFNHDIGSWNTANVTNMTGMFYLASAFNRSLNWNTAKVTNMSEMFRVATAFNQDIGGWNVVNVTNMTNMFYNVTLSTTNYDAILNGWNAQSLKPNVTFSGGNSKYSGAAKDAYDNMTLATGSGGDGWSITDGGQLTPAVLAIDNPTAHGTWHIGEPKDVTYTITHSGEDTATNITFSGLSGDWSENGGTCGASLSGGATCTYIVRLNASTAGAKSDTILLDYTDGYDAGTQVTRGVSATIVATDGSASSSDSITGDENNNTIIGGLGGDTIDGGDGDDTIYADMKSTDNYISYLKDNAAMVFWLDGTDPNGTGTAPSDGAVLSSWIDKSTSGFDIAAVNAAKYASDGINGRGAMRFDGSNDYYELSNQAALNATTQDVFVVAQTRGSPSTYRSPLTSRDGYPGYMFYAADNNTWAIWTGDAGSYNQKWSTVATISDIPQLLELTIDSPNADYYVAGESIGTSTSYSVNSTHPLRVGAGSTEGAPQFYFNGDISEVIIFNSNLTTSQREILRHVLSNKYGLPMADTTEAALAADTLTGGSGADTFVFNEFSFSDPTNRDTITDFSITDGDRLDFSAFAMDFSIYGTSGLQSSGHAEAAWVDGGSSNTLVKLDYNGDGTAEFEIELTGVTYTDLTLANISLNGQNMNDTGADTITGTSGNDTLVGGYGGDTISGGNGDDVIYPDNEYLDIEGMKQTTLWLDAGSGVTKDGSNKVSAWADRSATATDVAQGTADIQPLYVASGGGSRPAILFDGSNDSLFKSSVLGSTLFDSELANMFIVQYFDSSGGNTSTIFWESGGANRVNLHLPHGGNFIFDHGDITGGGRIFANEPAGFDDSWHLISSVKKGDNSARIYMDGSSAVSGSQTDALDVAVSADLNIGSLSGSNHFKGYISEVLVFNRDLSPANEKRVNEYLSYKYAIALDSLSFGYDTLTGGAGADTFTWTNGSHSGVGAGNRDVITDFSQSDGDKVDLSNFGHGITVFGHNGSFSSTPYSLIWSQSGSDTLVQMDFDGNDSADWEILLKGFTSSDLTASDFSLQRTSCQEILDAGISTGDGVYTIDPDGSAGAKVPFQVYCDMTTDGGGWTLVAAQFESDPVTNWNEGIQSDYDPTLATSKGFAFSSSELPTHTEMGVGKGLDPTYLTYFNYTYTTGNIATTSIVGADGSSYLIHRDSGSFYYDYNPDGTSGNLGQWNNALTVEGSAGGGYTTGPDYTWAFAPKVTASEGQRGYGMLGETQFDLDSYAWTIWVRN